MIDTPPDEARSETRSFAELLGATSLAIAQPVFNVFGADASSFVAARAGLPDIGLFIVVVVLAPPVGLWVTERLVGFLGDRPRRWVHRGFIAVLVAMFLARLFPAPLGPAAAVVVILGAVAAVVALARTKAAPQFLRYLAFSPILFITLFVGFSPLSALMSGGDPQPVGSLDAGKAPPIVLVVLDELPLGSLLDGDGHIDADAYPALASLADDSTFARNHTTMASTTPIAVPTILTGAAPESSKTLPTAQAHSRNLFTLLGGSYDIRATEFITHLCPEATCTVPPSARPTAFKPARELLRLVPNVFTKSEVLFNIGIGESDPASGFEWISKQPDESAGKPTLRYLHSLVPHQPWNHLADGRLYSAPNPPVRGSSPDSDISTAQLARQRHLLQVAYTDKLLGDLLGSMRDAGTYDDALIIVTADHGVSFRPGQPMRSLAKDTIADIAWTPLLIKAPHQSESKVIDSPTSSIDVLPTIIDLLDVDVDWDLDGRSVFDKPRPADWSPRLLPWTMDEMPLADDGFVHVNGPDRFAEVLEQSPFDFGPDSDLRLWRWGEHGDLIGHKVASFEQTASGESTASIDDPDQFSDVDRAGMSLPVYLSGRLSSSLKDPVVIAVNGVVAAWSDASTSPRTNGSRTFQVMIPPSLLRDGDNKISVFLLKGDDRNPTLVSVSS